MAADLIVRIPVAADGDCAWRDPESGVAGHGRLADAGRAASGRRVHLVVPGSAVLVTRVAVPASQRSRALAAVPWALEDRLAEEVESLHFALGQRHDDTGEWSVAIVARRTMDEWLARCAAAGIQPASMRPESLALAPPGTGEWVALEEADGVVVRTAGDGGFACEPEMLALVAGALETPERIRRLGDGGVTWPAELEPLLGEVERTADAAAAFLPGGDGLDLLQGVYSRRERAGRELRRWRVPAGLALALLVALGIHLAFDYAALGARETRMRAQLQALFQQTFPDVQHVRDPRAQMAARLRSLRGEGDGGPDFADMLARTGSVLGDRAGARLAGLTWRGGTLELELEADDLQALDRVQRGLAEAGLRAELQGAERGKDAIEGRITVKEGGA